MSRSAQSDRSVSATSRHTLISRVAMPRFLIPPTRIFSSRNPAAGTSRFSTPRSVPTNTTSMPHAADFPRHRDRRNHMAARAASRHHKNVTPQQLLRMFATFSRIPSDASVTSSELPPKLIMGSGIPFVGTIPEHDAHIEERLHDQHGGDSQREIAPEFIGDQHGRANPAPQDHHEPDAAAPSSRTSRTLRRPPRKSCRCALPADRTVSDAPA